MPRQSMDSVNCVLTSEYDSLKVIAKRQLQRLPPGQTMGATALVHEAYMKVAKKSLDEGIEHNQILMMLSFAIRDVVVQHVRSKIRRLKRNESYGVIQSTLRDRSASPGLPEDTDLLELDHALRKLELVDHTLSEVVVMHSFGELSLEKIAEIQSVSHSTIKRRWRGAKAWMLSELSGRAVDSDR